MAHTISEFGSAITREALPLAAILVLGAAPAQMGLLGALASVPVLVFGLAAGVWVDRVPRRPIMLAADLGRAVIVGSVPVAAFMGHLTMELLYIVVLLAGTLTVFFNVADQSFLPAVVEREHIVEGNSKLGAAGAVTEIGAPAIAGTLVQLVTAPVAILVDAVSFLFSALFIWRMRTPEPPPVPHEERESGWRDAAEGMRVLLGNPLLRALTGVAATDAFFGGFFVLYALYGLRVLGLTPALLGLLVASGGLGSLVGAGLTGRAVRRFGLGKTLLVGGC